MNVPYKSEADPLSAYGRIWREKPILQLLYNDFFDRLKSECVEGVTLEIGGGGGNLKAKIPGVISSDIQFAPWLDVASDAQQLPFGDGTISNIIMIDVLHHIEFPALFFSEASRVLMPGGRIVIVEPAITYGSFLFYRFLHHEPMSMRADPLAGGQPSPQRNPYDSNQAIPTLIATRFRNVFREKFPTLSITKVHWFSFLAYPCSGGFQNWSLITVSMAKWLLAIESRLEALLGRFFGFRLTMVFEKKV